MTSPASVDVGGQRRLIGLEPGVTTEIVMFTAAEEFPAVVGLIICNSTAGPVNATVRWSDGVTDFDLMVGKVIPANDFIEANWFLPLRDGYQIKVTSSAASSLTFTLITVDHASKK